MRAGFADSAPTPIPTAGSAKVEAATPTAVPRNDPLKPRTLSDVARENKLRGEKRPGTLSILSSADVAPTGTPGPRPEGAEPTPEPEKPVVEARSPFVEGQKELAIALGRIRVSGTVVNIGRVPACSILVKAEFRKGTAVVASNETHSRPSRLEPGESGTWKTSVDVTQEGAKFAVSADARPCR
jgi:hypothetical protein